MVIVTERDQVSHVGRCTDAHPRLVLHMIQRVTPAAVHKRPAQTGSNASAVTAQDCGGDLLGDGVASRLAADHSPSSVWSFSTIQYPFRESDRFRHSMV